MGDVGRYTSFLTSMVALQVPVGTQFTFKAGVDVPGNLNACWRDALEKNNPQWAWIQGDDHTFDPDILTRLLDHHVDVVAPLVTKRKHPFTLLAFPEKKENRYRAAQWPEVPEKGLWELKAVASAGLLLSRRAMDALGDPWFDHGPLVGTERVGWDMYLCDQLRYHDFPVYCDPTLTLGHTSPVTFRPMRHEGTWGLAVDLGHSQILHLQ